jgi:hypothetical protein
MKKKEVVEVDPLAVKLRVCPVCKGVIITDFAGMEAHQTKHSKQKTKKKVDKKK